MTTGRVKAKQYLAQFVVNSFRADSPSLLRIGAAMGVNMKENLVSNVWMWRTKAPGLAKIDKATGPSDEAKAILQVCVIMTGEIARVNDLKPNLKISDKNLGENFVS